VAALGRGFVRFDPSGRAGVGWVTAFEMPIEHLQLKYKKPLEEKK
jgi:hypothetical protein